MAICSSPELSDFWVQRDFPKIQEEKYCESCLLDNYLWGRQWYQWCYYSPTSISYNHRDGRPCRSCITEAVYDPYTNKGSSLYGDTFYHLFSVQIDTSRGISSYTVTVYESDSVQHSPSIQQYDIQDRVIWLPELSSITDNDGQITGNLFAAVR